MTLITIDAVVDVSRHLVVMEIVCIISPMTAGALEYRVIVRIRMTRRAHTIGVAVRCRELRVLRVVEASPRPCGRVVAGLARGREELRLRRMARVRSVVVIGLMAANARDRQCRVVIVDVTIGALSRWDSVRSSQRKCGVVVIKSRIRPEGCVVTQIALLRESGGHVVRIGGVVVVGLVTRHTGSAVQAVIVVLMAIGALARWHGVLSGQGEACAGMVEQAIAPLHRVVTGCACGGERGCDVVHR